jgi:hypothetical protein
MSETPHPQHGAMVRGPSGGVDFPAKPLQDTSPWHQWRRQRACHKAGGHWWHPADAMIAWFCCQCGVNRDGIPQDGSR